MLTEQQRLAIEKIKQQKEQYKNEPFLIKTIRPKHWKNSTINYHNKAIQWFLQQPDQTKQEIINIYNQKYENDFWEYVAVEYCNYIPWHWRD